MGVQCCHEQAPLDPVTGWAPKGPSDERTSLMRRLLVGAVAAALSGFVFAASASAAEFPQLWTNSTQTVPLRSVKSSPVNQPDALEFGNTQGPMVVPSGIKEFPVLCNEVEIGTTVLVNSGTEETKLAVPFGVAEGDNCIHREATGREVITPTYFDTGAAGNTAAQITIPKGEPFEAILHKLKMSLNRGSTFCTTSGEGIPGTIGNVTEGFVEESPPNLSMIFSGPVTTICGKTKEVGTFFVDFFLETMSTTTDTAFVGTGPAGG
jgi:hypothetical protein